MNEWPSAIWASISAMTAALILTMVYQLGGLARESANIQHEQDLAIAIVQEYREYAHLDNATGLYPQDVITTIGLSGGTPEVSVETRGCSSEPIWTWSKNTVPDEFSTTKLTERFSAPCVPVTARYHAIIHKDLNGAVTRIEFRRED